jgi:hypothetical protein
MVKAAPGNIAFVFLVFMSIFFCWVAAAMLLKHCTALAVARRHAPAGNVRYLVRRNKGQIVFQTFLSLRLSQIRKTAPRMATTI